MQATGENVAKNVGSLAKRPGQQPPPMVPLQRFHSVIASYRCGEVIPLLEVVTEPGFAE